MRPQFHVCKLINVVGIDGSGKTILCKGMLHEFQQYFFNTQYVHTYHKSILLKPINSIVKALFMRGTDQFANYSRYREQKTSAIQRHRWLSRIYAFIWILDYTLQTLYKVGIPLLFKQRLIIDRYVYDAMINISVANNFTRKTTHRLVDFLFRLFPEPDIVFLIDLPEVIAFERKNDIQSIEYLQERRHRYLLMADQYGFQILDGTSSPQELLKEAIDHCCV